MSPAEAARGGLRFRHNLPDRMRSGCFWVVWIALENEGAEPWSTGEDPNRRTIALCLNNTPLVTHRLPSRTIAPGESLACRFNFRFPELQGEQVVEFRLGDRSVAGRVASPISVEHRITMTSRPTSRSAQLRESSFQKNSWFFQPTEGARGGSTGVAYPLFVAEARGCRFRDVEGQDFVDYVMGWGAGLLGHADRRIREAIVTAAASAATVSLPHALEMEVTERLCGRFAGAEMVLFGKNGSDVCTAAARLARAVSGRSVILTCGYHGWQDWSAEPYGFEATGVPARKEPLVLPFGYGSLDSLDLLLEANYERVAAVFVEPAGVIEGLQGPIHDADRAFLSAVAAKTRAAGAVLVFDEIMTGFRYREGSVQQATGVVPDLTCLGKALGAGMPLSALVGRRDIFTGGMHRIFYHPTYKGEVYSLAAARRALEIYDEVDVPGHVWEYGRRLAAEIVRLCADAGLPGRVIGPPFRMVLVFDEPDEQRVILMRTLLQQELLKQRVFTFRGLMLPSLAHDDEALAVTAVAYEKALAVVAEAARDDSFVERLEIPEVISHEASMVLPAVPRS